VGWRAGLPGLGYSSGLVAEAVRVVVELRVEEQLFARVVVVLVESASADGECGERLTLRRVFSPAVLSRPTGRVGGGSDGHEEAEIARTYWGQGLWTITRHSQ